MMEEKQITQMENVEVSKISEIKPAKVRGKMALKRVSLQKKAFIKALEKNLGIVSSAAKAVGVDRKRHYEWLREDPEYKEAVEGINELALDFAESQLHEKIKAQDTIGIIFYLKTKGKKRGYIEKVEQEITSPHGGAIILKLDPGCEPITRIEGEQREILPGNSGL